VKKKKSKIRKILIVDDDEILLKALDEILSNKNYETKTVNRVDLAIDSLAMEIPNLILLDLVMPQKYGTELLKVIKKDDDLKNIPVILISSSQNIEESANEYGANSYLEKPFAIDDLYKMIKFYIS
jgi:DNA-binding NtrC family response regulator